MEQYIVTGMSCAACQARVEKAVSKVPGVDKCSVSLLTNSMGVEGNASQSDIIKAVKDAGYGASLKINENKKISLSQKLDAERAALEDKKTPLLKKRLIWSVIFLLLLMYFSMGHMMFGWPLPAFFNNNHVAIGLLEMILAAIVLLINKMFFISGFKSLIKGAPNMDSTIALGSGAAFVYSVIMLFAMTKTTIAGNDILTAKYMDELYFESSAMILTLITVGKLLESISKGRTTDALKSLMKLVPKTAIVIKEGKEIEVEVDELEIGDIFVVRPGDSIPVDGVVIEGSSAINESSITGESIPVDKIVGDTVTSATLNQSGFLKCKATRVGTDTSIAQIIQMVSDASATKAPVAKLADTISGYFVPSVIAISLVTIFVWLIVGQEIGFALSKGICVLVVSCPCALGLATPVAIMVGNGKGARNGILFKTAEALQETGRVQIVALDKTGTITSGIPKVTDMKTAPDIREQDLIDLAYSLEVKSAHPLAKAIVNFADERDAATVGICDFQELPGNGVKAVLDGEEIECGSFKYIASKITLEEEVIKTADSYADQGKTPILFMNNRQYMGMFAIADTIKEDSAKAIQEMKNMGIHVVMLTGDNRKAADLIGAQAGVDEAIAGVLPDGKEEIIRKLQKFGKVAMVGDGINDAPALTRANVGIAIGSGTDIAIDSADVVLMKSNLSDAAAAIRLSRRTYLNIIENLFWAFIYNIILIPIAAGVYYKAFGLSMSPMLGALAMSLSSFCVVSNALRLNLMDIYESSHDHRKNAVNINMNALDNVKSELQCVEISVEGMMCEHCEATVNKALESIPEIVYVKADHNIDKVYIKINGVLNDELIRKTIEDKGYEVKNIQLKDEFYEKDEIIMKKTIKIEGMMCEHCEASVKKALEAIDGVESAEASHVNDEAIVVLSENVDNEVLKKAVEDKDYKVIGIE